MYQLINQSFDILFVEECAALRAPELRVQFQGREGRAQRKKTLGGPRAPSKPSKVLSEGEQKVLAMADFLAEARLAGITAPVVFDDPVSSLDHRRVQEVADRITLLSDAHQVVVFTHDIFFANALLSRSDQGSRRCTFLQISDEDGKGKVTQGTRRWDTLGEFKKLIEDTIRAAEAESGEARTALVRQGYDHIRSWCEVFAEKELLRGATERFKPNVSMGKLSQINTTELANIIPRVVAVFDEACRHIPGHSQPLITLGVAPTLQGLKDHWAELQECKRLNS